MRITESKLRRLIRHVINESIEVGEISKLLKSDFDFESFNSSLTEVYEGAGDGPAAKFIALEKAVGFIKEYFQKNGVTDASIFKKIMQELVSETKDKQEYVIAHDCSKMALFGIRSDCF